MKNKIVLNIVFIYFFILSIVLIIQLSSKKINAVEPLPSEITAEDRLKSAVVLAIDSPVIIVNEKQFLIDEKDSGLVPISLDGKVYIPAKLLKTAFGADITFNKQEKRTVIRLDNKALIFSNNGTSIEIIDNISKETIYTEAEAKIINNRFYIPLRSFVDIFDKEIFYNNDLIIISNMENLFDPIEEMQIISELEERVKELPLVGNNEILKHILSYASKSENITTNNDILNVENLQQLLEQNKPVIIKKTNNYNIYATDKNIEVYFVTEDNKEVFSFKVEKISNNIKDILITDDRFIVSYEDENLVKTAIYDIQDRQNVKFIELIENNASFYKSIIKDNKLYIFSKKDVNYMKKEKISFVEYSYVGEETFINNSNYTLNDISYFPDMNDNVYTLISCVNLYNLQEKFVNTVFLGMGNKFFINDNSIYIYTTTNNINNLYKFNITLDGFKYVKRCFISGNINNIEIDDEKQLFKISLDNDEIIYLDDNLIKRE